MKSTLMTLLILFLFSFSGDSLLRATQETSLQEKSIPIVPLDPKHSAPRRSFIYISGIEVPLREVIRDRDAWREIWKRIHGPYHELPALPEIDFSLEMIVVVALGVRPSSGYDIFVDRAYERDDQLEIIVRRVTPKHCGVLTVMTAPVDVVRIKKTTHPVVFKETKGVHVCN